MTGGPLQLGHPPHEMSARASGQLARERARVADEAAAMATSGTGGFIRAVVTREGWGAPI